MLDAYGNDTERLQEIFTGIAQMIPTDWSIEVEEDPSLDRPSCGAANNAYYAGGPQIVKVPGPYNAQCLFIALHEFGHVLLGHSKPYKVSAALIGKQERAASMFALAIVQGQDVKLPPFTRYMAESFADIQEYMAKLMGSPASVRGT